MAVKAGIVAAVILAILFLMRDRPPAGMEAARGTLAAAAGILDRLSADTASEDAVGELETARSRLALIPAALPEEYAKAAGLTTRINDRIAAIDRRRAEMAARQRALAAVAAIRTGFEDGSMDAAMALAGLAPHLDPGAASEVAAQAGVVRAFVIDRAREAERAVIAAALRESEGHRAEGRYRAAAAVLKTCLEQRLERVGPAERRSVEVTLAAIETEGVQQFRLAANGALERAKAGDIDGALRDLDEARAANGLPAIAPVDVETRDAIAAVRTALLNAARAAIAADIAAVERLEAARSYAAAAAGFRGLAGRAADKLLVQDLTRRSRIAAGLAAAQEAVSAMINREGGIILDGVGAIGDAAADGYAVTIEGAAMRLSWDRLTAGEYAGLHARVLAAGPCPAARLVLALHYLATGKLREADVQLVRVRTELPEMAADLPEVFAALDRRAVEAAAAEDRAAAERDARRQAAADAQWKGVGPRGPVGAIKPGPKKAGSLTCGANQVLRKLSSMASSRTETWSTSRPTESRFVTVRS